MKRRIFFLISILISVFFMVGCGGSQSPKTVVQNYFTEIAKGENAKVKDLVYNNVEEAVNDAFKNDKVDASEEDSKELNEALNEAMSKLSVTTEDEKIEDNTATVNVTVKGVNLSNVLVNYITDLLKTSLQDSLNGKLDEDKLQRESSEKLVASMKNATTEERKGTITLTKMDDKWKIDMNSELKTLLFGKVSPQKK